MKMEDVALLMVEKISKTTDGSSKANTLSPGCTVQQARYYSSTRIPPSITQCMQLCFGVIKWNYALTTICTVDHFIYFNAKKKFT